MTGRLRPELRGWVLDGVLAFALASAALIESQQPGRGYTRPVLMTVCALLVTLPLVARRRFPVPVALFVAAVGIAEALTVQVPASAIQFVASLVALYTVVSRTSRQAAVFVGGVSVAAAAVIEIRDPSTRSVFEALPVFAILAAVVLLAVVVRRSRQQAQRLARLAEELASSRAEAERLAAAGERVRIARDMHDLLAHSVSVMVLQVGAARMALHEREPMVRQILAGVEEVGRDGMDELRTILGVLREGSPALAGRSPAGQLDRLVGSMRDAGMTVTVDSVVVLDDLRPAVGAAVLRLVQEGLTNVLKHAGPVAAHVRIDSEASEVAVTVTNAISGTAAVLPAGGHGLVGLRERADGLNGTLSAAPLPDGGWQIRGTFPLVAPSSAEMPA